MKILIKQRTIPCEIDESDSLIINSEVGDLSLLETEEKGSIVLALNEVANNVNTSPRSIVGGRADSVYLAEQIINCGGA